mmetsp:Transcript_43871/g.103190  ORF Transcript_43871/g.103190 Transcript_43871/m.103190 type:complete len:251 (-) Transcript_43871:230-982(-)
MRCHSRDGEGVLRGVELLRPADEVTESLKDGITLANHSHVLTILVEWCLFVKQLATNAPQKLHRVVNLLRVDEHAGCIWVYCMHKRSKRLYLQGGSRDDEQITLGEIERDELTDTRRLENCVLSEKDHIGLDNAPTLARGHIALQNALAHTESVLPTLTFDAMGAVERPVCLDQALRVNPRSALQAINILCVHALEHPPILKHFEKVVCCRGVVLLGWVQLLRNGKKHLRMLAKVRKSQRLRWTWYTNSF